MTYQETVQILATMIEFWPSFQDRRDIRGTAAAWQMLFEDEPFEDVRKALTIFASTDVKGFPPVPGQLKAIIAEMHPGEAQMTEAEAWALVIRAVGNSLYHAREEFDALPPICQQIVNNPSTLRDWAMMDEEDVHSVVASNFQRSYRARAQQAREFAKLPASVRAYMPALEGMCTFPRLEAADAAEE